MHVLGYFVEHRKLYVRVGPIPIATNLRSVTTENLYDARMLPLYFAAPVTPVRIVVESSNLLGQCQYPHEDFQVENGTILFDRDSTVSSSHHLSI